MFLCTHPAKTHVIAALLQFQWLQKLLYCLQRHTHTVMSSSHSVHYKKTADPCVGLQDTLSLVIQSPNCPGDHQPSPWHWHCLCHAERSWELDLPEKAHLDYSGKGGSGLWQLKGHCLNWFKKNSPLRHGSTSLSLDLQFCIVSTFSGTWNTTDLLCCVAKRGWASFCTLFTLKECFRCLKFTYSYTCQFTSN